MGKHKEENKWNWDSLADSQFSKVLRKSMAQGMQGHIQRNYPLDMLEQDN